MTLGRYVRIRLTSIHPEFQFPDSMVVPKPHLSFHGHGWKCASRGVYAALGPTPEAAYNRWHSTVAARGPRV